jgi:hypothetical protein
MATPLGKTKAYLHRLKIIESLECPCEGGTQTVERLIYDCIKLQNERGTDKQHIQTRKVASEEQ